MARYYVANENGDWWSVDTESGQGMTLFVISEEGLARYAAAEYPEEAEIDLGSIDKLEQLITQHGRAVDLEF
jgi:hypothetical protein